jgi:hypothetical protein
VRDRVIVGVAVLATALAAEPAVSYFARTREISTSPQHPTNYLVVDEELLRHARPDLADLRIYSGETQIPYALVAQAAGVQSAEYDAKILNLGIVGGSTEFDLDLSETVQYNRVRLSLDAKDFLVTAQVFGKDALAGAQPVDLGVSTLYDFSRESLGSNTTLKLATASFRYLHVKLTTAIRPTQVKGATVYSLEEKKSYWTDVGSCGAPRQIRPPVMTAGKMYENPAGKPTTVLDCDVPPSVAINRVVFSVAAGQVNFRRSVTLTESDSVDRPLLLAEGDISRVQMKRGGTIVNSEQLSVMVSRSNSGHFLITVSNGDDPPLALEKVQPQTVEQRVFFEPKGATRLQLYYGDDKLDAPTYDYAKFFKDDPAAQAALGAAEVNLAFRGRPDGRPWSERHHAVLWLAMVVAVAGLGFLALRGLKQG